MKILFIGDIFGKTGRRAVKEVLPTLKIQKEIDFVIGNAENATHCRGLNLKHYNELMSCGIDFFTMGNHTWRHNEIFSILMQEKNIIRPVNIDGNHKFGQIGIGSKIVYIKNIPVRITNLIGESIKMNNLQTNPFVFLNNIINSDEKDIIHIVDFHAETTSEKNALFYEFKNKVTAIFGTHTHIQTSDNKIKNNTAYITDVGSTGPEDGVIGAKGINVVNKFKNLTENFILEEEIGKYKFSAVLLEIDENTKKPISLERILIYE